MAKNKVTIIIESCNQCPNATIKSNEDTYEDEMFCQTKTNCIMLKESWGYRPIPDWCPRLNRKKNLCGKRKEVPGIIS